jgi:hypothetical protein
MACDPAMKSLAAHSGVRAVPTFAATQCCNPSERMSHDPEALADWLESAALTLGIEAQPVESSYPEFENDCATWGRLYFTFRQFRARPSSPPLATRRFSPPICERLTLHLRMFDQNSAPLLRGRFPNCGSGVAVSAPRQCPILSAGIASTIPMASGG